LRAARTADRWRDDAPLRSPDLVRAARHRARDGHLRGRNGWRRAGHGGPCPPVGRDRHFFKLHALDRTLPGLGEPDTAALLAAMERHVPAQGAALSPWR